MPGGWTAPCGFEHLILPALRRKYEHHPALAAAPKTALTALGIPGDPLNVGLTGGEHAVDCSMLAVGWGPADPITLICRERTKTAVPILTNASST